MRQAHPQTILWLCGLYLGGISLQASSLAQSLPRTTVDTPSSSRMFEVARASRGQRAASFISELPDLSDGARSCLLSDSLVGVSDDQVTAEVVGCLREQGYPYAQVFPTMGVKGLVYVYRLVQGPLMRVQKISLAPSAPFGGDPSLLWQLYPSPPGAPFRASDVVRFKERLERSEHLTKVSVVASPIGNADLLLTVTGVEGPPNSIALGMLYDPDEGLGLNLSLRHAGAFAKAGKTDLSVTVLPKTDEAVARLTVPLFTPLDAQFVSASTLGQFRHPAFRKDSFETLGVARWDRRRDDLDTRSQLYLGAGAEIGETTGMQAGDRPMDIDAGLVRVGGFFSSPPIVQSPLGLRVDGEATFKSPIGKASGSERTHLRYGAEVSTLGRGAMFAGWRASVKAIGKRIVGSSLADTPLSDRLYLGGSGDLRGYSLAEVGTRLPAKIQPIGGVATAVVTPSLSWPVGTSADARLGIFMDFAGLGKDKFPRRLPHRSVGLEFSTITQFGKISAVIATPQSDDATQKDHRFYLLLGDSF